MREIQDITLPIPGAVTAMKRYFFPRFGKINDSIIGGLQIPLPGVEISSSFAMGSYSPVSAANLKYMFICLCDKDGKLIHQALPYYTFNAYNNGGNLRDMFKSKICIEKSYVYFTGGTANNEYVLFNFILYTKKTGER